MVYLSLDQADSDNHKESRGHSVRHRSLQLKTNSAYITACMRSSHQRIHTMLEAPEFVNACDGDSHACIDGGYAD